jgi:hypothetical protein
MARADSLEVPVCEEPTSPYNSYINTLVEDFELWLCHHGGRNGYNSLQTAFRSWLERSGLHSVRGNYTDAVAVILVFMSRCLANPRHRRFLTSLANEPDEYTLVQVYAPEHGDDQTFWEFFTEENFRKEYEALRLRESAQGQ